MSKYAKKCSCNNATYLHDYYCFSKPSCLRNTPIIAALRLDLSAAAVAAGLSALAAGMLLSCTCVSFARCLCKSLVLVVISNGIKCCRGLLNTCLPLDNVTSTLAALTLPSFPVNSSLTLHNVQNARFVWSFLRIHTSPTDMDGPFLTCFVLYASIRLDKYSFRHHCVKCSKSFL